MTYCVETNANPIFNLKKNKAAYSEWTNSLLNILKALKTLIMCKVNNTLQPARIQKLF